MELENKHFPRGTTEIISHIFKRVGGKVRSIMMQTLV